MYHLQNRWKLEEGSLYYYGMRSGRNLFRNRVRVSAKQAALIKTLPKELTENEKRLLRPFLGIQIVEEKDLKAVPKNMYEATFCCECCANDFIIPGLEFDEHGRCPMCQTAEEVADLKSVVPLVDEIPRSHRSRFDAAVFYTGGKDSTFLLYYLSKVKGLRVLALTWEIPFMSASAKASIEGAKKAFDTVEFISRSVNRKDLNTVYQKLYEVSENTCACPSLAYVLFYPELVANRVPYFLAGNEPVQMTGLYYNHIAPKIAYLFATNTLLTLLMNIGRVLTLHPPLRQGQFQTLMTMKQLAYGDHPIKKWSGYESELVSNIVSAIHEVPSFLPPLRRAIRSSSRIGCVPAFVHIDFNSICGGTYNWNDVKSVLVKECGWVPPDDSKKALHTSCKIERCKDHSQFNRFYHCRSKMIPFSAIEMSLASRHCGRSKEETLYEMEYLLGFTTDPLLDCAMMRDYLEGSV